MPLEVACMVPEIKILGPVALTIDDLPVALGERKQRILLAVLAMKKGPVENSRLAELLWTEEGFPADPTPRLQQYVYRLRAALREANPDSALLLRSYSGIGYELEVGDSAVDYRRFRWLAALAKQARPSDPARSAALGREALAEWGHPAGVRGGRPLDGREPQLERLIEGMRQEYQAALITCLTADLACGRYEHVVAESAELAAYDQYGAENQELARLRMLATYRSGNRAVALEIYEHLRETLNESLAADPDEETRKLKKQIINDDPALRPATPEAALPEAEEPTGHIFHQTAKTITNVERMEAQTINLGTFGEPPK